MNDVDLYLQIVESRHAHISPNYFCLSVVMVHDSSNFYRKYKHSGEAKKALEMVPAGVKAVLALNKV